MFSSKKLLLTGSNMSRNIKALQENLAKKRQEKALTNAGKEEKPSNIPSDWGDFCRLTKIRSGNKIVSFDPYYYQLEFSKLIDNHHTCLAVKTRQLGLSQLVVSKFLHKAILNGAYTALVLSRTQDDTGKLAYRAREMIKSLDNVFLATDSLNTIRILGGGTIFFRTALPDATRGIDSVSDVLIDEAAFIPTVEETYGTVLPCMEMAGDDARMVILSTPNSKVDWYYKQLVANCPRGVDPMAICDDIRNKKMPPYYHYIDESGWAIAFIHWRAHPIYSQQEDYLERLAEKRRLPITRIKQEYDLSFSENTEGVFTPIVVENACILEDFSREYDPDKLYFAGLDTSTSGDDYTVLTIFCQHSENEYELVDMYRKRHVTMNEHLYQIKTLISKYDVYKVAVEVNSGGQLYYDLLVQECCSDSYLFVSRTTTQDSKLRDLSRLTYLMETEKILFPKKDIIINEFLAYQRVGKQLNARSGQHDDIIMSMFQAINEFPIWNSTRYSDLLSNNRF